MRLPLVLLAATLAAACNKEADVDLTNATPEQVANAMKESGIASDMRQPGLWATTMTVTDMQVPGMPPEMVERMKQTLGAGQRQEVCVTQAEIDKLDSFIAVVDQVIGLQFGALLLALPLLPLLLLLAERFEFGVSRVGRGGGRRGVLGGCGHGYQPSSFLRR